MILSAVHVYGSAHIHRNNNKDMPKQSIPVFETIDEARKSLVLEKGNHEYLIVENSISVDRFDVCWIENNTMYKHVYTKKITSYR